MMTTLAEILTKLGGSSLLVPGLLLALTVSLYQQYGARQDRQEARIEQKAEEACDARWALAHAKRQQTDAQLELQAARQQMEAERDINTGLAHELSKISTDYENLRRQLADTPAADPSRCLSDSVLSRLRARGDGALDGEGAAAPGKGGRGNR